MAQVPRLYGIRLGAQEGAGWRCDCRLRALVRLLRAARDHVDNKRQQDSSGAVLQDEPECGRLAGRSSAPHRGHRRDGSSGENNGRARRWTDMSE